MPAVWLRGKCSITWKWSIWFQHPVTTHRSSSGETARSETFRVLSDPKEDDNLINQFLSFFFFFLEDFNRKAPSCHSTLRENKYVMPLDKSQTIPFFDFNSLILTKKGYHIWGMFVFYQVVFFIIQERTTGMSIKQWAEGGGEEEWRTDVGQTRWRVVKPPTADLCMHIMSKKRAHRLICLKNERCGRVKGYRQTRLH